MGANPTFSNRSVMGFYALCKVIYSVYVWVEVSYSIFRQAYASVSSPDSWIYVILTLDTSFWTRRRRNHLTITLHDTHNMGFHVRYMPCLYKTTDSSLDQSAPGNAIPSCSPWKPVASSQWRHSVGGDWIEVAHRAHRFASGPAPGTVGEVPLTTVSSHLNAVSLWRVLDFVLTVRLSYCLIRRTSGSSRCVFCYTGRCYVALNLYLLRERINKSKK